jgi:hypothetical protein
LERRRSAATLCHSGRVEKVIVWKLDQQMTSPRSE